MTCNPRRRMLKRLLQAQSPVPSQRCLLAFIGAAGRSAAPLIAGGLVDLPKRDALSGRARRMQRNRTGD